MRRCSPIYYAGPVFTKLPRRVVLVIYIYNGVESEKHALFRNPVSGLGGKNSSKPPRTALEPQR
jgi:hypothetical protein